MRPGVLALKHPGILIQLVLQGMHRNFFVFCLNFRQVNQLNQKLWAKKGLLKEKWAFWGHFSHKVPRGREPDSKNG